MFSMTLHNFRRLAILEPMLVLVLVTLITSQFNEGESGRVNPIHPPGYSCNIWLSLEYCDEIEGEKPVDESICKEDSDCQDGKLCCFTECSKKECLKAMVNPFAVNPKDGFCPAAYRGFDCGFNAGLQHECVGDQACPGSQKCCEENCVFQCREAVSGYPGKDPNPYLNSNNLVSVNPNPKLNEV